MLNSSGGFEKRQVRNERNFATDHQSIKFEILYVSYSSKEKQ